MWQFWIILSGLFFIIEMATVGFLVFWFGIGSLIAMIVSLFTANIAIQTSVFVFSSAVLLFFTRPLVNKLTQNDEDVQTNAYSIIGKKGIVIKEIDPILEQGQVKIGTEVWSAKTLGDKKVKEGTQIEVVKIDGVKVVVK